MFACVAASDITLSGRCRGSVELLIYTDMSVVDSCSLRRRSVGEVSWLRAERWRCARVTIQKQTGFLGLPRSLLAWPPPWRGVGTREEFTAPKSEPPALYHARVALRCRLWIQFHNYTRLQYIPNIMQPEIFQIISKQQQKINKSVTCSTNKSNSHTYHISTKLRKIEFKQNHTFTQCNISII